jgi:hypothetical protein
MVLMDALADLEPRWSGPWPEDELDELPAAPGLYCVCECAPDDSRLGWRATRPLFIGESQNVRQAVQDSSARHAWRDLVKGGHAICFGFKAAPPTKLDLMQSAMIAYYRPPGNDLGGWA